MEKLYYIDRNLRSFIAEIEEVREVDNKYYVRLDRTAFFPGGGGQIADRGTIENLNVIDVFENEGEIIHVLEKKPVKIHKVKCEIDWKRRFDGMQQHLGQHVLSGCFFSLFGANTVSFHMGSEISTVDIQGFLEEDKIYEAEKMANEIIEENIEVQLLMPNKSQLKKMKLRREIPKSNEQITVVKIGDLDINACCGVHPTSTLDLAVIKIKRWEKHKGATRIEFLAGNRAITDYFKKDSFAKEVCKFLSCGESDALNSIKNITLESKSLKDENRKIKEELSEYKIKEMINDANKINGINVIVKLFANEDIKYIGKLAEKICYYENNIVLFAIKGEDKVNLIFSSSKNIKDLSMSELLKDAITLIDGRGGGSRNYAQGGGKSSENIQSTLEYALRKIQKEIY